MAPQKGVSMSAERDRHLAIVREAVEALVELPNHLRGGLQRYLEAGIEPGGFLLACIEDRFSDAVARAKVPEDDLLAVGRWLLMHAPGMAWGSREQRIAWQIRARHAQKDSE
jgi:hypothetical protein